MSEALTDLASTLTIDEVPAKLRCVNCSRIAVDAFKLLCCGQPVCGSCESELPETCPQCQFTSTPELREIHIALRRTVTVWLKTLQKKRAKQQAQPSQAAVPAPDAASEDHVDAIGTETNGATGKTRTTQDTPQGEAAAPSQDEPRSVPLLNKSNETKKLPLAGEVEAEQQVAVQNDASTQQGDAQQQQDVESATAGQGDAGQLGEQAGVANEDPIDNQRAGAHQQQIQDNAQFGMMTNMNGWGNHMAGMDPMKMMAMQNMAGYNAYNMMGMPGMSMDPSMMAQGMYGNYGQGMGMNAMNMNAMNMGMGYGAWGGASGMDMNQLSQMNQMNGGQNGYGYYPNGGNMNSNRGHFARPQFQNQNRHQQNRFRGSGSANRGYGRDRYGGQGADYDYSGQNAMAQGYHNEPQQEGLDTKEEQEAVPTVESNENVQQPDDERDVPRMPEHQSAAVPTSDDDQGAAKSFSQVIEADDRAYEIPPEQSTEDAPMVQAPTDSDLIERHRANANDNREAAQVDEYGRSLARREAPKESSSEPSDADVRHESNHGGNHETTSDLGPNVPLGPAAQFAPRGHAMRSRPGFQHGIIRGGFDSRGGMRGRGVVTNAVPAGTGVMGAPTGPKALRGGRPNLPFRGGVARGGRGALMSPVLTRDRRESFGISIPPTGPAADRRHRSPTPPRREVSRPQYADEPTSAKSYDQPRNEDAYDEMPKDEPKAAHKASSSHHQKHRSRAHTDSDGSDHGHHSRHETSDRRSSRKEDRKRRHRSRSPNDHTNGHVSDADAKTEHDAHTSSSRTKSKRTSSRHRERHRDDPKSSHRHSRHDRDKDRDRSRSPPPPVAPAIPTGPATREFKIQGRSKRSELDVQKQIVREEKPNIDAHALEREARNRERMLKEQQRRGSYITEVSNSVLNGRKRSHAAVEDGNGIGEDMRETYSSRRKGRGDDGGSKRNRRAKVYDDWDDGNLEAQEQAREAERWG